MDASGIVGKIVVGGKTLKLIDALSDGAKELDQADKTRELTKAGRALQKHSGRLGSVYPKVKGNPAKWNEAGQKIVDDILNNPGTTISTVQHPRHGLIYEVIAPDGRGLHYDSSYILIGFREPRLK
jgi:filamentous hemagglutinin